MKKLAILFMIFIMPFAIAEELTEEQQMIFNRKKLSIEILYKGIGAFSYDDLLGLGSISTTTYRKWKAYQGFAAISEESFFLIAGYDFEAKKARKYKITNNVLMVSGGVAFLIGVGIMLGSLAVFPDDWDDPDYNIKEQQAYTLLWVGGGISIASAIPLGIGIGRAMVNWAPVSTVENIKVEYNKKLMKKIKK